MDANLIDALASELQVLIVQEQGLKKRRMEIEWELGHEFIDRSTDTIWASELHGNEYVVSRTSKSEIDPDEFIAQCGEKLNPEQLRSCVRPKREVTKEEPARVMMKEVTKILKQGGEIAQAIESVTKKITKEIKVTSKETK
jgi:hypothetical protein|tara:strand:- start:326 stop:748 length:423 start_codon:yes stop_codon:yes gene_type:complete